MDSNAAVSSKLSVLVVSYNHEKYIGEAIESILFQETDFPIEILIADDCSTDGTPEIIHRYQAKHPGLVRVLDSQGNLGITRNYQRGFAACSGEYIAVLEGDDYWLNKDRLATMVQFLDEHPECAVVFNRILYIDEVVPNCYPLQWWSTQPYELSTGAELASQNFIGNFSACIYRSRLVKKVEPRFYEHKMYDWLFNLAISRFGVIAYLPRIMSAYRQHSGGTWSAMMINQKLESTRDLIPLYNELLQGVYAPQLNTHIERLNVQIQQMNLQQQRQKHPNNPFLLAKIIFMKVLTRVKPKIKAILGR